LGVADPILAYLSFSGTWMLCILPFVEQQNLYNTFDANSSPQDYYDKTIPLYYCPSEPRSYSIIYSNGGTDYVGIEGLTYYDTLGIINSGGNYYTTVRVTDVTDGTSNTLMLGERPPAGGFMIYSQAFWWDPQSSLSGVANTTWVIPGSPKVPCSAPPYYFGGGPLNVNDSCSHNYIWSNHTGGANFAMGDGSVRFISYSYSSIMPALATKAGGGVVEVP
jgi:prepilin-type processing-associated H-X9-DG protein